MVAPVPPVPEDQMKMRLRPRVSRLPAPQGGSILNAGRPPFNITIEGADGQPLLVMREVNGRLVVEGDEGKWDEAAKRFLHSMLQWTGQFPVRWKDEVRKAVEGPQK
jgi:hypothetical protein